MSWQKSLCVCVCDYSYKQQLSVSQHELVKTQSATN